MRWGVPSGDPISREARVVCWHREDGQAYEAEVSLSEDRVVAWEHHPGEQPNITADEFHECDVALREDARVVEALDVPPTSNGHCHNPHDIPREG